MIIDDNIYVEISIFGGNVNLVFSGNDACPSHELTCWTVLLVYNNLQIYRAMYSYLCGKVRWRRWSCITIRLYARNIIWWDNTRLIRVYSRVEFDYFKDRGNIISSNSAKRSVNNIRYEYILLSTCKSLME